MLIYTIDYDNSIIMEEEMGEVANLEGFNREMDEMFGEEEWFTDIAEAEERIKIDLDNNPESLKNPLDLIINKH